MLLKRMGSVAIVGCDRAVFAPNVDAHVPATEGSGRRTTCHHCCGGGGLKKEEEDEVHFKKSTPTRSIG